MHDVIRTGGGTFDPGEENIYFIAANTQRLSDGILVNHHVLVAVNELETQNSLDSFASWANDSGKKLFLDSGVYNLSTQHAKRNSVTMDEALSLSPHEIDGFSDLFDRYVSIVRSYGEKLWGYIEIDQGGRENKIKTRAKLEALGLRPIPVYHPLNDGWDYFDYLAERYDRICFGNIVKADSRTRLKLITTAWERHRKYPHLWIHVLGLSPNQWMNALPVNSCDSSSWLTPMRWPAFPVFCDGQAVGKMGNAYRYVLGTERNDPRGSQKGSWLSSYMSRMGMLAWRRHVQDMADLGFERYPAQEKEVIHG